MEAGRAAPVDVIVVAAGTSSRMGGLDKLTSPVAGRPLLAWTLEALADAPCVERLVLVTSPERVAELRAAPWLPAACASVVAGGALRQRSVEAGLAELDRLDGPAATDDRVVLVHDGARPLVSAALVERVAAAADVHGAAIPIQPIAETIKRIGADRRVEATVDRATLAAAQTPQGARRGVLRAAFAQRGRDMEAVFTDEAALLEACRIPVHAVDGEPENIKVTVQADLRRVDAALRGADATGTRHGIGQDSHPFGPGEPLVLGGVTFEGAPRLHGHSDGDVALHALADALLGAAVLGDLGRVFPAGPATPRGIDSRTMLVDVVGRVRAAGWRPVGVDLTIVAARPRLGSRLDAMRAAIAGMLELPEAAVNVKASTGNLDGMEGAGRGISALAVATIAASGSGPVGEPS